MTKNPTEGKVEIATSTLESHLALYKADEAWNHMRANLGLLFCRISGLDDRIGVGIWRSLKSDRIQDLLLEAAVTAASADGKFASECPKAKEDIIWLIERLNSLAGDRYRAIKAETVRLASGGNDIRPPLVRENQNRTEMRGEVVVSESDRYGASVSAIRDFAAAISTALACRHFNEFGFFGPWPDRPLLSHVSRADNSAEATVEKRST